MSQLKKIISNRNANTLQTHFLRIQAQEKSELIIKGALSKDEYN
jgi:hypothetical protein